MPNEPLGFDAYANSVMHLSRRWPAWCWALTLSTGSAVKARETADFPAGSPGFGNRGEIPRGNDRGFHHGVFCGHDDRRTGTHEHRHSTGAGRTASDRKLPAVDGFPCLRADGAGHALFRALPSCGAIGADCHCALDVFHPLGFYGHEYHRKLALSCRGIQGDYNMISNYELALSQTSPDPPYCEAISALLNPNAHTIGIITQESLSGALAGSLSFDQGLLLLRPTSPA